MNNRGQFTIIAALLVSIVLAGTLIAVYATVRYESSQSQKPQTLTATDETNAALSKALGFTVGYYGSILQVTGNQTYAYVNATTYMNSALQYIASMNPSLGETINMTSLSLSTNWFSNPSISTGKLSVLYDLADLGIYGINYTTSCSLGVQIFNSPNANQVRVSVTKDLTEPLTSLGQQSFAFYYYNYSTTNWQLVNPSLSPTIFDNGTYLISVPSGIDASAYMVQVTDSRGIMVAASSFSSYNMNFAFSTQSSPSPAVVELLQNGTMRWFGQGLVNVTEMRPIPPISLKSIHLSQTGSTSDIPFQVEDWASQYQIPLSLSSNYTIFSNNQMVVFEVSPSMSQLTLWWNGSDVAIQPSAAYQNIYFTGDNPAAGSLSNGNCTLQFSYPGGAFQIKSTVGSVSSTANFMRIDATNSTYGSSLAYVIQHGVVRDIVQEEPEWNNGPANCPNVYSQIVFTFPANVTYYTYQLRLIAMNSAVARSVNDISPIQLTTSLSSLQAMTEDGTINGIPNVTNGTGIFTNSTGNAHHWSQLINTNSQGTGIMFTDSANQQLYAFDAMADPGEFTGALYVNSSVPIIELDPVTSGGPVNFASALDLAWYGSVITFDGANPICTNNGASGLWPVVEQPPTVTVTLVSSASTLLNLSPSSGFPGTSVTVSGGGLMPNSQITITFNGNTIATTTTTVYGSIPIGTTFVVPSYAAGSYSVTATDTSYNSASANFTILAGSAVSFVVSGFTSPVTAGTAGSVTVIAKDSVGNIATGYVGTVKITSSDTLAALPANAGLTSGVGSFNVTLKTAGSQSITATDTVNSSITGAQTGIAVNVAAVSKLIFTAGAGQSLTAGIVSPTAIVVQRQDAYGNPVSLGTSAITVGLSTSSSGGAFYSNSGGTTVITSITIAAGSSSSLGFYYKDSVAASPTLTGAYSSLTSATTQFTINAGSLSQFAFSNIGSQVAGAAFSITITAQDQYGNAVTGYSSSVPLSVSVGTISPTSTGTSGWSSGVWTGSVTLTTVGSGITIIANDGGGHTGTSNSFTVNPGALASFSFGVISSPQTAGTAFSITITAKDANGNAVTGYSSSVPLSVSVGTISPTSTGTSGWSSGVWTGSVTLTTVGSGITIIANDGGGHTGTSNSFTVNPGALASFSFGVISSPQTAGTAFSITITAKDANGNTVTSYVGTNTLTVSSGTISPTSTTSFVAGVWTGSVTLVQSGSGISISTSGSSKSGTSNTFTVNAVPPTLDVSKTASTGGATSYTVSLTTIKANDILYVAVSTGSSRTATISGGGLTWAQRASVAIAGSKTLQTFWALKATAGAITITVTLSGSAASAVVASAISGANTASPFDVTTPSSTTGSSITATTTISTTNPDFIIGAVGVSGSSVTLTKGTSFTAIGSVTSVNPEVGAEYKTVTTVQTNLGVSYTLGSSNNWAMIADAIKGA